MSDIPPIVKSSVKYLAPIAAAGAVASWGTITAAATAAAPFVAVGIIGAWLVSESTK